MKQLCAGLVGIAVCLSLVAVPRASAQARPAGDAALMPADAAVAPWKKAENSRVFTKADLYGYIDGGAEVFLELGFDQLTLQKYRNGPNEFVVEIYRMADEAAGFGTYLMKCGAETPDATFKARHTINRHQLLFQKNRYYVAVNNVSGTDKLGSELLRFGQAVAAKVPADVPVPELQQLPAPGLVPGTTRIIRGPYTLQGVYTLGDGDMLQLGGKLVGVAGNYKDAVKGNTTVVAVTYPDAAAAKKAFTHVTQNLDKYLKPVRTTATRLVFKDYENKFGVVSLTGKKMEVTLHLAKDPQ